MENLTDLVAGGHSAVRRDCIIVAGMHRSGTSALTRTFNLLGATLPKNMLEANDFNEKGYFESEALSRLNEAILVELGLSWNDIADIDWASIDEARSSDFRARISQAVEADFPDGNLLIIKDPRVCRLLPLWKKALQEQNIKVSFAIPVRHPLEVADSLKRRDDFPLEMGCLLWLRYVLEAERETRGLPRSFTNYADILSAAGPTALRMASMLGNEQLVSNAQSDEALGSFIDPALRHHTIDPAELKRGDSLYPWIDQAYAAFAELILNPNDAAAQSELDDVHARFQNAADAFVPLVTFQRQKLGIAVETASLEVAGFERRLAEAAAQTIAVTAQLTEAATRIALLETQLTEQNRRTTLFEAQVVEAATQNTAATQQLVEQTALTNLVETRLTEQIARTILLEAQLAEHTVRATAAEKSLAEQTERTTTAQGQLFDQITLTTSISEHLAHQVNQTIALQKTNSAQTAQIANLENAVAEGDGRIIALLTSSSWTVTAPMRWLKRKISR